jgi:hypothetical protein
MPDIIFATKKGGSGHIELKFVPAIPTLPKTPIRVSHYTEDQKNWIYRCGRAGGAVWLLIRIVDEVYLFEWQGAQLFGTATLSELRSASVCWGKFGPDTLDSIFEILEAGPFKSGTEQAKHRRPD